MQIGMEPRRETMLVDSRAKEASVTKQRKWIYLGLGWLGLVIVTVGLGLGWMSARLAPDITLGTDAPDVSFQDAQGKPLELSSLTDKVVLLDFWSSG